jgi:hypothetical protein
MSADLHETAIKVTCGVERRYNLSCAGVEGGGSRTQVETRKESTKKRNCKNCGLKRLENEENKVIFERNYEQ